MCTGSTSEMRTLGGEVAFISAIIYDSLLLKDRYIACYVACLSQPGACHRLVSTFSTYLTKHIKMVVTFFHIGFSGTRVWWASTLPCSR